MERGGGMTGLLTQATRLGRRGAPALLLALMAGCAEFPELDRAIPASEQTGDYPALLPVEGLIAQAEDTNVPEGTDAALAARLADTMLSHGVYVIAFSYPVVPEGKARIRTQMSAAHTPEQIDQAVAAFAAAGRQHGIIS